MRDRATEMRTRAKCSATAILVLNTGVLCLPTTTAIAQPAEVPSHVIVVDIDSGLVPASGGGTERVVIWSNVVSVPDARWLRLHFAVVVLSGSAATNDEAHLRISSTETGAVQTLNGAVLTQWLNTSASFAGDSVLVELLAIPGTGNSRVHIDKILMGDPGEEGGGGSASGGCPPDPRVRSSDPRAGRLEIYAGGASAGTARCTAFLFNGRSNALLTAGHCCAPVCWPGDACDTAGLAFPPFVEFNVPSSNVDGTPNPSDPRDQYIVDRLSWGVYQDRQVPPNAVLVDWCYFAVHDNADPMTGESRSPLDAQGSSYRLADVVPAADNRILRLTGFGADGEPTGCVTGVENEDSLSQQTDSGVYFFNDTTTILGDLKAAAGASGAAYEDPCIGLTFAIHSGNAGCTAFGFQRRGFRIDWPFLRSKLACPVGADADCNDNGIPDPCDVDCGAACSVSCGGCVPISNDCNGNGIPDECEPDCNNNSIADACDITSGQSLDSDGNLVPDECQTLIDCNANGTPDVCDIEYAVSADCNRNGLPDECESQSDCDNNGILDICEDCTGNGLADACDILAGTNQDCAGDESNCCSAHDCPGCNDDLIRLCVCAYRPECCMESWSLQCVLDVGLLECGPCNAGGADGVPDACQPFDCDGNGIPDACDLSCTEDGLCNGFQAVCGTAQDCNDNCILDRCEMSMSPISLDCDSNGILDECDMANCGGEPACSDCNGNGYPDGCELECNGNQVPDDCDIANGTSEDCNTNGVPDECDPDCNENGMPDECEIAAGLTCDADGNGVPDECGACCDTEYCVNSLASACQSESFFDALSCAEHSCKPSACCEEGGCSFKSECQCVTDGGFYAVGPPTTTLPCQPINASSPCAHGLCCFSDGSCSDNVFPELECDLQFAPTSCMNPTTCAVEGGTYHGYATCATNSDLCVAPQFEYAALESPVPEGQTCPPPSEPCISNQTECVCVNADSCVDGVCTCSTDVGCRDEAICRAGVCYIPKNRFISVGPLNVGEQTAIRVTLKEALAPFDIMEGESWWLGPPEAISELASVRTPIGVVIDFKVSRLQCTPYYTDWDQTTGECSWGACLRSVNVGAACTSDADCSPAVIHVYGPEIVPDAEYELQAVQSACDVEDESAYSAPLRLETTLWGDVNGDPYLGSGSPPDGVVNITDITVVLDKFSNIPGAVAKVRVDVAGNILDLVIMLGDVTLIASAFSSAPYPYTGPGLGPQACP